MPAVFFRDEKFRKLSTDAKVLYGILLNRMDLSAKNGWFDEQGRVYIICTLEEIMETMNCADNKATKLMDELEDRCGLIERKRQGQGRPNLIYVKNFISSVENSGVVPLESRFKLHDLKGNLIAVHEDINDTEQTVKVPTEPPKVPPTVVITGDENRPWPYFVLIGVSAAALMALSMILVHSRKRKE